MERTQIYLTEEERRALKALATRLDRSQSALIREAIDRYVDRYQEGNRLELLRPARGLWADALIATSATARGAELLTFNRRHYPMFEGVRVPYRRWPMRWNVTRQRFTQAEAARLVNHAQRIVDFCAGLLSPAE